MMLCVSLLTGTGCSAWQGMSKTGQGATIGAGSGAAAGGGAARGRDRPAAWHEPARHLPPPAKVKNRRPCL